MSAQVEQPTSSLDLSVISASIDGGYTSEEALYSIDSKRFEEFKNTVKSVKFKDLIEEHEPEETLSPRVRYKHDPKELFDIFDNREKNPSPEIVSEEESDDFHINNRSFEYNPDEPSINVADNGDTVRKLTEIALAEDVEDEIEVKLKDHNEDKIQIEVESNCLKYLADINEDKLTAEVNELKLSSPNIENITVVENIETVFDTSSSSNNQSVLPNISESNYSMEDTTSESFTFKDLQTNGIHESKIVSTEQNLSAQQGELLNANTGSVDESRSSSVVEDTTKSWKLKFESITLVNRLRKENKTLKTCKLVQDKVITGYVKSNKELQKENEVIKESYNICLNKNKELSTRVKMLSQNLDAARIEMELMTKLNEVDIPLTQDALGSVFVTNEESLKSIKNSMQTVLLKNEFLQQALIFLTKKVNNLYRYTLSPILFLLHDEHDSLDVLPTFESGNEIQTFIDSNSVLFNKIFDINQIELIGDKYHFRENNAKLLKDLTEYYDKLNELIASKLESVILHKS